MGFKPCKEELDIRMRGYEDILEYIDDYVDDLAFEVHNLSKFMYLHQDTYSYKIKGTGSIFFHLAYNFFRDKGNILYITPRSTLIRWELDTIIYLEKIHYISSNLQMNREII